ncbi:hypothetical protein [Pontixanthobacter sp.]|uniref:hypothetical protein n=1 Tax=Pontixanthobacter sp. TaxID=2792078 RepID=UPI003C7B09BA
MIDTIEWQDTKTALATLADLSRDALHIYAALIIFLGACWIFRWRARSVKPWALVLLCQCINEYVDMQNMLADDGVIWIWGTIKDTVNTMILPTLILLAARYTSIFASVPDAALPDAALPDAAPPGAATKHDSNA